MVYQRVANRRPEVYAIMGLKGHGKDTFAKAVVSAAQALHKPSDFAITHFADALKDMACTVFGLAREQLHDPSLKEVSFASPIVMDHHLNAMRVATCLPQIQPTGLIARSPRELMQFFGTEYVRRAQDDYWVRRVVDGLRAHTPIRRRRRVLIPDTRFSNEVDELRHIGAKVIKIVRIDVPVVADMHESERYVESVDADLILGVRTGNLDIVHRAASLIACNKFERAQVLDYRIVQRALEAYAGGMSVESAARFIGNKHPATMYFLANYYGLANRSRPNRQRVAHEVRDGVECKRCSKCREWRPLTDFNTCFNAWDGLSSYCRTCANDVNQAYEYSLHGMYKRCWRAAGKRRKEWGLTFADFQGMWDRQQGRCAYTGRVMTFMPNDSDKVSVDRVDSTLGYTPSNTVLCTARVNLMKRDMSVGDFVDMCKAVSSYADQRAQEGGR